MATLKQIQRSLQMAKKKLARLNKEATATKGNIKKLDSALKKAKAAEKAAKTQAKKPAVKKKTTAKKSAARKKA